MSELGERFWSKVSKTETCWLWTAGKNPKGYAFYYWEGTYRGGHRVAYEWAYGPIPKGLLVDHKCHVRHCVRPDHLRLATNKQNAENRQGARTGSKSGVRGVYPSPGGRWSAKVGHNGKLLNLGTFDTVAEASQVATAKRLELFTHTIEPTYFQVQ